MKYNLFVAGIVMLIGGIALAIYGYNVEPTVGEAIDDVFTGDFTDKRNIMMSFGLAITVVGGACMASSAFADGRMRST